MKADTTSVAFLWHLHQPLYKVGKAYVLPWVRLHCVKDYYPMAKLIEHMPSIRLNFNFSGVLLEQLVDYSTNSVQDHYQDLTLKDPKDLEFEEKRFIIERFFSINPKWNIIPHRRYKELYQKSLEKSVHVFSNQDLMDTQVYFNLIWFHSITVEKDPRLKKLFKKEEKYDAADKKYIIDKQYQVIKEILPLYKKLIDTHRIEVSVSPHYHPIIPLLCDTDICRHFPYLMTPGRRFCHPEDAQYHIKKAKESAEGLFKTRIIGSWPSEGAVSEDALRLFKEAGIQWLATDEDVLFNSLKNASLPFETISKQRQLVYRPYSFEDMTILFRDKNLSNMMSFTYQDWDDQAAAAEDLVQHLIETHNNTSQVHPDNIALIAMDGENAWEYYQDNGRLFLNTLYRRIEESKGLRFTTIQEYLAQHKESAKTLQRVAPGSWINADFSVWAGSRQNNRYWLWLKEIRSLIEQHRQSLSAEQYQKALSTFYILEGSDWYWWNTFKETSGEFKNIFNYYLKQLQDILQEHLVQEDKE